MNDEINKYVFIFSESIKSTNVQFNELQSIFNYCNSNNLSLRYVSVEEFSRVEKIASKNLIYGSKFNQSCAIATLEGVDFLNKIMHRASYIQSCGKLIKMANIEQIKADEIYEVIDKYLQENNISTFELSFYTQDITANVKNPLKEIMIDERRTYFSDLPFKRAKTEILDHDWSGRIIRDENPDVQARIWVFKDVNENDRYINWDYPEKRDDIHLIIYQPLFRLKNALYVLDEAQESKPYWKGIDTTPQRLMGAMINLAQFRNKGVFVDPFSHTGTSLLEALRFEPSKIYFSDKFESIGALDNIKFLTKTTTEINEIISQMEEIKKRKKRTNTLPLLQDIGEAAQESLTWVNDQPFPIKTISVNQLMNKYDWLKEFSVRLIFYLVRRHYIENRMGVMNAPEGIPTPTFGECETLTSGKILNNLEESIENYLGLWRTYSLTMSDIGEKKSNRGLIDIGYNPQPFNSTIVDKIGDIDLCEKDIPLGDNSIDTVVADPP